jgi:hypothetical protein
MTDPIVQTIVRKLYGQTEGNIMPTIKFVRVERDCPANVNIRERYADSATKPRLIYDFDVLIDGERRAQLKREYTGRGYRLHDADGRPIIRPGRDYHLHMGEEVANKADFEGVVAGYLEAGKIPTLAQMAELREQEAAAALAKRNKRLDDTREYHVKRNGIELYNALARFRSHPEVKELLAAVDREVADALTHVNE